MHTVYCHTCKTNLYTYVLGRGVRQYTRKEAEQAAADHVTRAPGHDVKASEVPAEEK